MKKIIYHLTTYGCQMNHSDSERIHTYLQSNGFSSGDKNKADILIFNACSVRQSAIDRVLGQIHNAKKNKAKSPLVVVTGCLLPEDRKKLSQQKNIILDIKNLPHWIDTLAKHIKIDKKKIKPTGNLKSYFKIQPQHSSNYSAYIPIMTGCNNFCSYCAVPYTRGREQSRPANDILKEIQNLIRQGYKEIILLGQNVNSYHGSLKQNSKNKNYKIKNSKNITFPQLLKKIDNLKGDYWLNFYSSHPKDLSTALINCYKTCRHLTPYLHLALQSGSKKILQAMNRHYTPTHYKKLIQQLRKTNSHIAVSTDIIVGFPGETKKDFQATNKLIKDIGFDMIYISQFSPRPNTAAAKLTDNITKLEKKNRDKLLTKTFATTALKINQQFIGQTIKVLIDRIEKNNIFGHTNQFKRVKIINNTTTNCQRLIGNFVDVNITRVTSWRLEGKLKK